MTTRREDEVGGMQRTGSRDGWKEDACCSGLLGSTQEVEREEDGNVGREEDGRRTGGGREEDGRKDVRV